MFAVGACGKHDAPPGPASASASASAAPTAPSVLARLAGTEDVRVNSIAVASDRVVVAGQFEGELGGQRSHGGPDLFVTALDAAGKTRWMRGLGSSDADVAWSVAIAGPHVVIAASAEGTIADGGARSRSPAEERAGNAPGVVIALDDAGRTAWMRALPGAQGAAEAIAADGDGVIVGGWTGGSTAPCASTAVYVARWSADGAPTWQACSRGAHGPGAAHVDHVIAVAGGGAIACGRASRGTLDFGVDPLDEPDHDRAFVAAFGADGAARWVAALGGSPTACRGLAAIHGMVVAAVSDPSLGVDGAVVGLDEHGTRWRETWGSLVDAPAGADAGTLTALAGDGERVLAAGTRPRGAAVLVVIDPTSGARVGAPIPLGDLSPRAIVTAADRVLVVGQTTATPAAAALVAVPR